MRTIVMGLLALACACASEDSDAPGSSTGAGGAPSTGGVPGGGGTPAAGGAGGEASGGASGAAGAGAQSGAGGSGAAVSACGGAAGASGCGNDGTGWAAGAQGKECELLELLNQTRASGTKCGDTEVAPVDPLVRNATLTGNAREHSEEMATTPFFDFTKPDGTPVGDWSVAGYCGSHVASFIGQGQSSAYGFLSTVLATESECRKLMTPGARGVGVGYSTDSTGKSVHVWTLLVGSAP
jgi:uncharacterized protein YkwD